MIISPVMDFYCERYKCRMMKSTCEARKRLAERAKYTSKFNDYNAAGCHKCNQGVTMKNKEEPQQEKETGSIPSELPGYLNIPKKECNKCHQVKIMDEFNKNHNCKDGHEGQCKACKYQHYKDKMASKKQAKKIISEKKQKPSAALPMKAEPFREYVVPETTIQDEKTDAQVSSDSLFDGIGAAMNDTKAIVEHKIVEENQKSMEKKESTQTEEWIYGEQIGKKELPGKTLSINFNSYPDIFQAIEDIARDEFRTPEMQVLFWLRSHLSSSGDSRYRGKMYQQG